MIVVDRLPGDTNKMLSAILFIRALHWKQPKHPSIAEWVNRLHCKHKMEYNLSTRTKGYSHVYESHKHTVE